MAIADVSVHILYGIPCVGKSTGAIAFAHHYGIRTVVHTDYLREVQRGIIRPESSAVLAKVTHNAWELYGPPTPDNIITGFVDHVTAVFPAIDVVVGKLVHDGFNSVLEGAHFHGQIIEDLRCKNGSADIQATLLVVRTAEELERHAVQKGRERASGQPLKEWQENIPFMLTIQDYLIADAHSYAIRVTTADEWKNSWSQSAAHYST